LASAAPSTAPLTLDSGTMLEFRNVSFAFSGRRGSVVEVLRNVSFACREDEIVAVIGPSGCGKSTLLSLATGLREPITGEILVDGKIVSGTHPRLAMLFQQTTLLPWRSVVENVELGLEIRGVPKESRRKRALALMGQYGLAGFERKYPHALSGGMQKRAALAQTLAVEPTVLLLDEPFAALDAQTRVIIQNDVVRICRAGKRSMLIVTHDIAEALAMADRVIVLTRRPATVKEIYQVQFSRQAASVADAPAMPGFADYYKRIWHALDISVTGMGVAA
jgi:NitT/TauT family transport system ATP-binding protein